MIILAQLVPISLLVSNEMVKAAQAQFIAWDRNLYDASTNQPAIVRNSQLHEDLGQVEYIFSDKTGSDALGKWATAIREKETIGGIRAANSADMRLT